MADKNGPEKMALDSPASDAEAELPLCTEEEVDLPTTAPEEALRVQYEALLKQNSQYKEEVRALRQKEADRMETIGRYQEEHA